MGSGEGLYVPNRSGVGDGRNIKMGYLNVIFMTYKIAFSISSSAVDYGQLKPFSARHKHTSEAGLLVYA